MYAAHTLQKKRGEAHDFDYPEASKAFDPYLAMNNYLLIFRSAGGRGNAGCSKTWVYP